MEGGGAADPAGCAGDNGDSVFERCGCIHGIVTICVGDWQ